mmetsp:Transcript_11863/g.30094  ORF Transcript_11863/g.30094 Transcript_11863/m.30094 type:complete len:247 (-) Transcript_11863:1553-2293(-)|eukprot:CAMPEP_0116101102 /NCGR_PEP_ID=MMETSP0327-20121206/12635_1 /TAXON_ID=44447 /ORGANISM="Pseudo-nitzschia delicatissima, Strain B596" /LENGTH=246 /DNA_ID=CAMNT_0003593049 /DNA_START=12 /DNA_END=752 /DNA_ORIENTATION=+
MDLGFGARNHEIGQATAQALMHGAQEQVKGIESEMAQYDRLLDDEDALEDLRKKRIEQMKKQYQMQKKYRELGHGTYTELGSGSTNDSRDIAKDFFQTSKESDRIIYHFYRPTTRYCDIFHAHLEKLAQKHLETKFVKINVEGCDNNEGGGASFLVERLGIVVMPTLVLVKDRKAIHHMRGFDELGGTEDFSTNMLAHVLGTHGITDLRDDEEMSEEWLKEQGINTIRLRKGAKKGGFSEFDDDFE